MTLNPLGKVIWRSKGIEPRKVLLWSDNESRTILWTMPTTAASWQHPAFLPTLCLGLPDSHPFLLGMVRGDDDFCGAEWYDVSKSNP